MRRDRRCGREKGRDVTGLIDTRPLAIDSTRVLDRCEPLRLVTYKADGSWQFLDGLPVDVDRLVSVHAHDRFDEFPADLTSLRDLPIGHLAER